jgi:hypothetical protein
VCPVSECLNWTLLRSRESVLCSRCRSNADHAAPILLLAKIGRTGWDGTKVA